MPKCRAEILGRRGDETALPLNGFGDHGGGLFSRQMVDEEGLQVIGTGRVAARIIEAEGTAVAVGIGHAVDFRGEGAVAELVGLDLAGQGHAQQRTTVKGVFEADDAGPLRRVAGHLDRVFHRFGAAVGKQGQLGEIAGGQAIQPFGQLYIGLVHGHMEAGMDELAGLVADGIHHLGVAVPNIVDADTAGEIDQFTAVDVHHHRSAGFPNEGRRGVEGPLGDVSIAFFEQFLITT